MPRPSVSRTCEICETPEQCVAGEVPCDLSGEFNYPVPRVVANKMLERMRTLEERVKILENRGRKLRGGEVGVSTQRPEIRPEYHELMRKLMSKS